MPFDKVIPGIRGAIRSRFNPLLFQDLPHRLPVDLINAQFAKLTNDPGVAKPRRLGDLVHQLTNLSWLSLSSLGIPGLGIVFGFIAYRKSMVGGTFVIYSSIALPIPLGSGTVRFKSSKRRYINLQIAVIPSTGCHDRKFARRIFAQHAFFHYHHTIGRFCY